jgi:hypothetical protein
MCVGLKGCEEGGFKDSKGKGGANSMQDGAVDLQHGTGVEGNTQPCINATTKYS